MAVVKNTVVIAVVVVVDIIVVIHLVLGFEDLRIENIVMGLDREIDVL